MRCISLTIVPDVDDPECADILVDVGIAGTPQPMVLDSGAAHTHLVSDERTAALPVVRTGISAGALAAGTDELVSVSDVRIGPVEMPTLDVVRVPAQLPGSRSTGWPWWT